MFGLKSSRLLKCATVIRNLGIVEMSSEVRSPTFFLGSGEKIDKAAFMQRISATEAKVICIGENHEDADAHSLELEIFKDVHANLKSENLALSLEFYDRESQAVLDEYLKGLVNLDTFLGDSRPPDNHADYQGLIDYCKTENLGVIASNCPRRYTRMVAKGGKGVLEELSGSGSLNLLPPLPYTAASPAYKDNFLAIMKQMGNTNPNVPTSMLDAQALWDATMAHSIAQALSRGAEKIIHVTGYFHIQHQLGTIEHLAEVAPGKALFTVVVLPAEEMDALDPSLFNIGDLVALTDINAL